MALFNQVLGELARQSCLTRTLQTGEHDDCRRVLREVQSAGFATEDLLQFLVDNLDDLLRRVECLGNGCAPGALLDPIDEPTHDWERDISFQ